MLIKNINIKNIGKLSDVNISPDAGLNVVFMPKEGGKTTLLSFLKYIFYGVKQKKSYKDLTFKERYMPWNSMPMAGSCKIEYDLAEYNIQRNDSNNSSSVNVFNLKTGCEDRDFLAPGKKIFGVEERAFGDIFFVKDLKLLSSKPSYNCCFCCLLAALSFGACRFGSLKRNKTI